MKKTTKTFPTFTDSYGRVLTEENIKTLYNYAQYYRYDLKTNNRINYCQAYFSDMVYVEINPIEDLFTEHKKEKHYVKAYFIKSYSTFVAVYLPEFDVVISFGRYSMTTYQHINKFIKNYTPSYTKTYNVEYVNWFGGLTMKKHKIRNVDLNVCCAEQKIAYNLAWQFSKTFYQDYFKAYKKLTENPLFGVAPNFVISELVFKARDDFMKEWKIHCEVYPKSNKYDIDLISHCLLNGLENYWKGRSILTSYEEIGKTFECLY